MTALREMSHLVENMYFPSSSGKLVKKPFQSGIMTSIKATIELFNEMKSEGVKYILTSKLNQDGL